MLKKAIIVLIIVFSVILLTAFFAYDLTASVIPGWHTTVFPQWLSVAIAIWLAVVACLYFYFKKFRKPQIPVFLLYLLLTLPLPVFLFLVKGSDTLPMTPEDTENLPRFYITSLVAFIVGQLVFLYHIAKFTCKKQM